MYAYAYYIYVTTHITNDFLQSYAYLYGTGKVRKVKWFHESCDILAINSTDAEKYLWSFQRSLAAKPYTSGKGNLRQKSFTNLQCSEGHY